MTGSRDLTFDRVEFFFGKKVTSDMPIKLLPSTPGTPTIEAAGTTLVASRQLAKTDIQKSTTPVERLNYFLDDVPDNHGLGDVVVAVGYRGDDQVGIGELRDFTLRFDATYEYRIQLTPATRDMEVWGHPTPDCVRWRDPDLGGVLITRANDLDCDSYADTVNDCAPLRYCDGTGTGGCVGELTCIVRDNGCGFGSCVNTDAAGMEACRPVGCLPVQACANCGAGDPIDAELYCALESPTTHGQDFLMHVHPNQSLCNEPQLIVLTPPMSIGCVAPRIEGVVTGTQGLPSTFGFSIASNGMDTCTLSVQPPTAAAPWPGIVHLLVSVDGSSGGMRRSFVFGLSAVVAACGGAQSVSFANDAAGTCN